ncbi:2318_t:CDS:1, partial [Scutellospora calospora]
MTIDFKQHNGYDLDQDSSALLTQIRTELGTTNPTANIYEDLNQILGAIRSLKQVAYGQQQHGQHGQHGQH